jgi:hypothetical protein
MQGAKEEEFTDTMATVPSGKGIYLSAMYPRGEPMAHVTAGFANRSRGASGRPPAAFEELALKYGISTSSTREAKRLAVAAMTRLRAPVGWSE